MRLGLARGVHRLRRRGRLLARREERALARQEIHRRDRANGRTKREMEMARRSKTGRRLPLTGIDADVES